MKAHYQVPLRYVEQGDQAGIELRSDTPCYIWQGQDKIRNNQVPGWEDIEVTVDSDGVAELYVPSYYGVSRYRRETTLRQVLTGDLVFVQLRPDQVRPTVATLKGSDLRHVVLSTEELDREPILGPPQLKIRCKEEKVRAYPDEYELFTLEAPTCPDCLKKTWYLFEVQPHFSGKPRVRSKSTKKPAEPQLPLTRFELVLGVTKPPVVIVPREPPPSVDIEEVTLGREGKVQSRVKQAKVTKEKQEARKKEILARRKASKGR